jgi:DegV family protein with EDD domain
MIGLLTDSSAQLTDELRDRHAVEIVPISVTVDGVSYQEGIDLDADDFFEMVEHSGVEVTTSQPSPGTFIASYERLAASGATEILAVLVGSEHSGTFNSARVASADSPVPVKLVDSGALSFGVSCCVLEAAHAIDRGAGLATAAAAAEDTACGVATTFIVDPSGVTGRVTTTLPWLGRSQSVMIMGRDRLEILGEGETVDEICDLLVEPMLAEAAPIRAAVCVADPSAKDYWVGMEQRLSGAANVAELLSYRVGPSVAAHTGLGTAGGYWHRLQR